MGLRGTFRKAFRRFIEFYMPSKVTRWLVEKYLSENNINLSYSQEGEDLILKRFFGQKTDGFYVDIGAFHPTMYSNTFLFYQDGWRGINIDARPDSILLFNKLRPRDINIECPVSDKEEELTYYYFDQPAMNTLSEKTAQLYMRDYNCKLIRKQILHSNTLGTLLDSYMPEDQRIDFMSVDVEGLDYQVLVSNNWDRYKPTYILVESLNVRMDDLKDNKIHHLLSGKGYRFVAKSYNTMIYQLSAEQQVSINNN